MNANGPVYGALEASADYMPVVDPKSHNGDADQAGCARPEDAERSQDAAGAAVAVLGRGGDLDQPGQRAQLRDGQAGARLDCGAHPSESTPAFCKQGSAHPSAKAFPIPQSGRQMQMYDPKTKTVTTIDTCFGTHHLNFDDNDVLWFTGGGPVEGWFDTRVYDKTKDEQKAQGWTVFVLDTNGNGKRDAYVEPDQPVDPTKDKRINAPFYGVAPTPGGRAHLGIRAGDAGSARATHAGIESAGDGVV